MPFKVTTSAEIPECVLLFDDVNNTFYQNANECGIQVSEVEEFPTNLVLVSPSIDDDDPELRVWFRIHQHFEEATLIYTFFDERREEVYGVLRDRRNGVVTVECAELDGDEILDADAVQDLRADLAEAEWDARASYNWAEFSSID